MLKNINLYIHTETQMSTSLYQTEKFEIWRSEQKLCEKMAEAIQDKNPTTNAYTFVLCLQIFHWSLNNRWFADWLKILWHISATLTKCFSELDRKQVWWKSTANKDFPVLFPCCMQEYYNAASKIICEFNFISAEWLHHIVDIKGRHPFNHNLLPDMHQSYV